MSPSQKQAWFNLVVITVVLIVVLLLYPFLGAFAFFGFGLFGVFGFGGLFYRKQRGQAVTDERDQLIQRRSMFAAYTGFWSATVAAAMFALAFYGVAGAVPVPVVEAAFFSGFLLVIVIQSVATLVQYGFGGSDARS